MKLCLSFSLDTRMIGFQTRWYHGWTPFSIQTGGSHRVSWKYFCSDIFIKY